MQYGTLKDVRVALDSKDNTCKGFAFVEFENEKDANAALAANNYELKKRRIAVTIASASTKAKFKYVPSLSCRTISSSVERNQAQADTGLGRQDEIRSRSFMVKNLPPDADDGRLQQELEKVMKVKRVEVFKDKNEAVVELESAAVRPSHPCYPSFIDAPSGPRRAATSEGAHRVQWPGAQARVRGPTGEGREAWRGHVYT